MIINSNKLKGKFTHWVDSKYKEDILNGKFKLARTNLISKPAGLWLSWNGGWEQFCKDDFTSWMGTRVCLKAKIKPNLKIWLINTFEDFLEVWNRFTFPLVIKPEAKLRFQFDTCSILKLYECKERGKDFWEWLQREFKIDGVALTDIGQCETRMSTWLYGWDVASVVIFNPKNVILTEV